VIYRVDIYKITTSAQQAWCRLQGT